MEGLSGERAFIAFLIDSMCTNCNYRLQLSISEVSKLLKDLPGLHPCNLHRKQHGNLEQLMKTRGVSKVFQLDNTIIRPQEEEILEEAVSSGLITSQQKSQLLLKKAELETKQLEARQRAGLA